MDRGDKTPSANATLQLNLAYFPAGYALSCGEQSRFTQKGPIIMTKQNCNWLRLPVCCTVGFVCLANLLPLNGSAQIQQMVAEPQDGSSYNEIHAFDLYNAGLFWWSGGNTCSGEFLSCLFSGCNNNCRKCWFQLRAENRAPITSSEEALCSRCHA